MQSAKINILATTALSFLVALFLHQSALAHGVHLTGTTTDPHVGLQGTDSKGSYSHGAQSEGSKSKSYSHGAATPKSEGSKSKSYSHGTQSPHGSIPKLSEGSGSKSYSHGYSHHGKSEGSASKGYSHGSSGHGYSRYGHGSKSGHSSFHAHKKCPFSHVLRFKEKLGLTPAQVAAIQDLRFEYNKVKIKARADHKIAHMEMDRLVHAETVDEKRIRVLADVISSIKSRKIHALAEAKIGMMNILTAEQRKKVAEMHSAH